MSQLSGLGQTLLQLSGLEQTTLQLLDKSVFTAQCYSSVLFRRQQENLSLRHEGTSIQRCEQQSAPAPGGGAGGQGESESPLASPSICSFLLPGPALCKLGLVRSAVLPEVLTPVLGPSFDLPMFYFRGLFSSLSFSHCNFGLLFPILTT